VLCHPEASKIIGGRKEQTIFFDFAGNLCRVTPDAFEPGDYLTELKSTFDASPAHFPYHAVRMAYHAQIAMQVDGAKLAGLEPPERLYIVAVESREPYAVAVFGITPRALDFGRRLWRSWMEQFIVCRDSDSWPGYGPGVIDAPEESAELIMPDGDTLEIVSDQVEAQALIEGELPLIGLAPSVATGILPSKLHRTEAAALAANRERLVNG
jgi:hypothetical protein